MGRHPILPLRTFNCKTVGKQYKFRAVNIGSYNKYLMGPWSEIREDNCFINDQYFIREEDKNYYDHLL